MKGNEERNRKFKEKNFGYADTDNTERVAGYIVK